MLGKLLPVFLLIIGVGAGVGAGLAFKPAHAPDPLLAANPCGDGKLTRAEAHESDGHDSDDGGAHKEYVKLNNQFVVPVVSGDKVESLVVLSLSVEVTSGRSEEVYNREPKLRDAFLQVLFDHANMGGFRGAFTDASNMDVLRRALQETARKAADDLIRDVLIVEINRQDV